MIMNIRKNRAIILLTTADNQVTTDLSNQLRAWCKWQALKNPRFIRVKNKYDLGTFKKIAKVVRREKSFGNKPTIIISGDAYIQADNLFILCTLGALSSAGVIEIFTYEYNKYCKFLRLSYSPELRVRTLYTATKYFKRLMESTEKQQEQTTVIHQCLLQLVNLTK